MWYFSILVLGEILQVFRSLSILVYIGKKSLKLKNNGVTTVW